MPATVTHSAQYTPVTAITPIPGTDLVLSGSATRVRIGSLNSRLEAVAPRGWTVFDRERVHRIVFDPLDMTDSRKAVILGGKEAVVVEVSNLSELSRVAVTTLARFALDDFAGDAAFLSHDRILISTLHNSIHVFSFRNVSACDSRSVPFLRPVATVHAPARPLLWTSRFSRTWYGRDDSTGQGDRVRIAGGSLLGEVLIWDIDLSELLTMLDNGNLKGRDSPLRGTTLGRLSRLNGHRGAIFAVTFSTASPDLLASGSDDRTIRVWDLSPLSAETDLDSTLTPSTRERDVESRARVLWGHEGRVWRIEWVDGARLLSVAEDATCRLWALKPAKLLTDTTPSTLKSSDRSAYTLVRTWRDGHDGRTIWSVNVARLQNGEGNGVDTEVALTGGADGAIRSWTLPGVDSPSNIRSGGTHESKKKLPQGAQIRSFVVAVDPSTDEPVSLSVTNDGSFRLSSDPSTSPSDVQAFHSSDSFANTATSLHLFFDPPEPGGPSRATLHAFTNRGMYLCARLELSSPSFDSPNSCDRSTGVLELTEVNLGIKAVSCTFDSTRSYVGIWERATWQVHVSSLGPRSLSRPPVKVAVIGIEPSLDGSTAPTSFCFAHDEPVLVVGNARGQISLYSIDPPQPQNDPSITPLAAVDAHSDGVSDLRIIPMRRGGQPEVESVGRDGMRKVIKVNRDGASWDLRVVDERWIAKGTIEKILVRNDVHVEYLALVDTRAGVFDAFGRLLYSFESPAKQSSSRFVETRTHGSHYFCVVQGRLTHQRHSSSLSAIPSIVTPGMHGREIRAVQLERFQLEGGREVTIVATAAENGVLAVSQLRRDDSLRLLYLNRYLPSSLKSLSFSTPRGSRSTLYACGTRELVAAFELDVVSLDDPSSAANEQEVEVRVLERGVLLADVEGGEVRTMDLALVEMSCDRLVVAGYSNGKLRLWRHDQSHFVLLGETEGLGKCVLAVEAAQVCVDGKETLVIASGQSDGRLSLWELSSSRLSDDQVLPLPEPFFTSSTHQSGINGLSVSVQVSGIIVATAGDDNAVTVQRIELSRDAGRLVASRSGSRTLADAHASTVQGLDFLAPNLLVSSSVEQRLNLYSIDMASSHVAIDLVLSTCLDVADCSAQAAVRSGDEDRWKVVVAGIGLEIIDVSDHSLP